MASTTTMTSSLPQGSLKLAFARLDDDIYNSLAASQPASPSLGATKPILQPSELATPLSQTTSAPTSAPAPAPAASKQQDSNKAKIAPVLTLLTTPNLTTATIKPLTTPDATFLCPHWNIPESAKSTRRHSSVAHTGPSSIAQTFSEMRQHRQNLSFDAETSFASGDDVAVFGHVQWESGLLGRRVRMPFAVWAKVVRCDDGDGVGQGERVEFMQIVGE